MKQMYKELSDYKKEDIDKGIGLLIQSGLLEEVEENDEHSHPQLEFLLDVGVPKELAIERLKVSNIAVFGLGAHGAHLVASLANEGVGRIKCFDSASVSKADLYLSSFYKFKDIGKRREERLIANLKDFFPNTAFEVSNVQNITEQDVVEWIQGCDFTICCVDKSFSSIYYWLNKAALESGLRWCASSLDGIEAVIGPIIIPGYTACYMCYKMRLLANKNSYFDAISYEKYLNNRKMDELYRRSILAVNSRILGNFLALESLKQIIGFAPSPLAGRICVINFLELTTEFHSILQRPDCPHCGQKKKQKNSLLPFWVHQDTKPVNILKLESELVSSRVGVIKGVHRLLKDALEPELPFLAGVVLSNFNYQDKPDANSLTCSGKGMTLDEMNMSALGEAVERYCGGQYNERKIFKAQYQQLTNAVNPKELVLYSSEQYASGILPYAEFRDDMVMQWVTGYSLIDNKLRTVPAIAVYLNFIPHRKEEYLFAPTSNGLAAGSNLNHAILNGLLEVIERDAFLITWLCKLPMPQIDLTSIENKKILDLVRKYDRRSIKIHVNALILDTEIPAFLASAIDFSGKGPAATVGLSAHTNPEIGILKAIEEIGQIRPHITREMRKPNFSEKLKKLMDFKNVKTIQDHESLYTTPKMVGAFDFLLKNEKFIDLSKLHRGPNGDINEQLTWCLKQIEKLDMDTIAIDLTTTDIASLGLSVVRIVIPKLQPMHFGYNERRLGGQRLFSLPERIGFFNRRLNFHELNQYPHPLG